jgi:hypothetical protein
MATSEATTKSSPGEALHSAAQHPRKRKANASDVVDLSAIKNKYRRISERDSGAKASYRSRYVHDDDYGEEDSDDAGDDDCDDEEEDSCSDDEESGDDVFSFSSSSSTGDDTEDSSNSSVSYSDDDENDSLLEDSVDIHEDEGESNNNDDKPRSRRDSDNGDDDKVTKFFTDISGKLKTVTKMLHSVADEIDKFSHA